VLRKIIILSAIFTLLPSCVTKIDASFENLRRPMLLSNVPYPNGKNAKSINYGRFYLLKEESQEERLNTLTTRKRTNLHTTPKSVVRGFKKSFIKIDEVKFKAYYYDLNNNNASLKFDSSLRRLKEKK
jgi:hypothetical protein